jgi:hypothetical protein
MPVRLSYLGPRHLNALHHPLRKPGQIILNSYREIVGDVSSRVVVARYRHLWGGAYVWHVAVMIRTDDGPPKDRVLWTRRDQRIADRTAEGLIRSVGEGDVWDGAQAGMFNEATAHRLRRLSEPEQRHLPRGVAVPIIDLFPPMPAEEAPDDAGLPDDLRRVRDVGP